MGLKKELLICGFVFAAAGSVAGFAINDFLQEVYPKLSRIQTEASVVAPDVPSADLDRANRMTVRDSSEADVLWALDQVRRHNAYRIEFIRLGGGAIEQSRFTDIALGFLSSAASLGSVFAARDFIKDSRKSSVSQPQANAA